MDRIFGNKPDGSSNAPARLRFTSLPTAHGASGAVPLDARKVGVLRTGASGAMELVPAHECTTDYVQKEGELCACASCEQVTHLRPEDRLKFVKDNVAKWGGALVAVCCA